MIAETEILKELNQADLEAIQQEGCAMIERFNDVRETDRLYRHYHKDIWNEVFSHCERCNIELSQFTEMYNEIATDSQELRLLLVHFFIEQVVDTFNREML